MAVDATSADGPGRTSTAAPAAALRADDLTKRFSTSDGEVVALEEASFACRAGEFVTLVGPSGCGKTTLLNLAAGLLEPTAGRISLAEAPITGPREDIGVMFQQPVLFPWRTNLENVLLPADIAGQDREAATERALVLLDRVGLGDFASGRPTQLSGGMQQRVALCRLLLQDPKLMLLDEPFGALDEFTREDMNRQLLDIWAESNKSVLLVTHNIQEAVFLADRVFVMTPRPGRIAGIVEVDLPRPRSLELTTTPQFQTIVREIRRILGAL